MMTGMTSLVPYEENRNTKAIYVDFDVFFVTNPSKLLKTCRVAGNLRRCGAHAMSM